LKDPDTLLEILHSIKAQYLAGSSWLMSPSAAAQVRRLKDGQGHYLWQPSLTEGSPNRLFGYPVYLSDDLAPLQQRKAEVGIIFGNFAEAYHIVDRNAMSILRDPFSAKPYVEFYATKRVGGDVVNFEALKLIRFAEE
jgi:HK97 family phage major capsid protein